MSENKKIGLNIIMSVTSFAITIIISLFVTPYIVEHLGGEAYGFVGLANNFVSYATIVTIALNSMASRFVSIEIYKKDYKEASKYFTSVLYANIAIAILFFPIIILFVWKMQYFLNIPENLLADVKLAFLIVFVQFLFSILFSHFEIATFVTNKLYLGQRNNIISASIRLLVIIFCFSVLGTKITYLTLGSFVGALFLYCMNFYYTKKMIPNLKIKKDFFNLHYIKRLIQAGVWNLLNKLSGILLEGLDLLITNLLIGTVEMGALSLSKTIPAMFMSLRGTLDYPFTPPMTKCYAEGDISGVVKYARMGNKVLGIFMIAPMATFVVYGRSFFELWVPSQDAQMIQILSMLAILSLIAGACINSVHTIFTITNRLRTNSLVILATGIATIILNFILLKTTNLGVYVIAGVSSILGFLRNFIFTPLYGAYCLNVKKTTFYHEILTGMVCLLLNVILGIGMYYLFPGKTWFTFIISCGIMTLICLCINFYIVLDKAERQSIFKNIKLKIYRHGGKTDDK